jgi:hypothetical protein
VLHADHRLVRLTKQCANGSEKAPVTSVTECRRNILQQNVGLTELEFHLDPAFRRVGLQVMPQDSRESRDTSGVISDLCYGLRVSN